MELRVISLKTGNAMVCYWLTRLVKVLAQCQALAAVVKEAGLIICSRIEFVIFNGE